VETALLAAAGEGAPGGGLPGWWLLPLGVLLLLLLAGRNLAALAARAAVWLAGERPPGRPRTGREGLIGKRAVARTDLAPRGKVFVHGELWDAVAERPVAVSQPVEVVDLDGLTLTVRPVPDLERE
jgi:membrane protein implicated in regulation of membrane protease activity